MCPLALLMALWGPACRSPGRAPSLEGTAARAPPDAAAQGEPPEVNSLELLALSTHYLTRSTPQ